MPVHKAMGGDWAEVAHRTDKRGRRRVVRMVYEVVAFQALRDQLKCKEIWVVGADKWRNPDTAVFVDELREQMTAELTLHNDGMPKLSWLDIAERKSGAIRLTAAEAQPEPRNLRRIKAEVQRRWGVVPLVDMRVKHEEAAAQRLGVSRRSARNAGVVNDSGSKSSSQIWFCPPST